MQERRAGTRGASRTRDHLLSGTTPEREAHPFRPCAGATSRQSRSITSTLLLLLCAALTPYAATAQPECGCGEPIADFSAALADERIEAVVLGTVIWAEGSPRPAPESLDTEHPYPWLRYLVLAEKAWKAEVSSIWVERLWGRCGSPLEPGTRVLLTLPKGEQAQATTIAGMKARTLDACQLIVPESQAGDEIAALGTPRVERERNAEAQSALPAMARSMMTARTQCFGEVKGPAGPVSMVPGEFVPFDIEIGGGNQRWTLGQNGTGAKGTGELILAALNPTACWVRIVPRVRARWSAEGSAGRLLPSYSGITWRQGWVPPYWNGTISLGRHPWIRSADLHFELRPTMPSPNTTLDRRAEAAGTRTLRLESLEPEPGRLVDVSSRIRATVRWLGADSPRHVLRPVFEAEDSSLVMAVADGEPEEWTLAANQTTEVNFGLAPVLAEHDLREPLQLRFVVDRVAADGTRETVDSTQPLEFGRGIEPDPIPVPPPDRVWYGGGDGSSCEQAIVVRGAKTTRRGIAAERAWWRKEYPGSRMTEQGLLGPDEDGVAYDRITLRTASGDEVELCFEITEFFGR